MIRHYLAPKPSVFKFAQAFTCCTQEGGAHSLGNGTTAQTSGKDHVNITGVFDMLTNGPGFIGKADMIIEIWTHIADIKDALSNKPEPQTTNAKSDTIFVGGPLGDTLTPVQIYNNDKVNYYKTRTGLKRTPGRYWPGPDTYKRVIIKK
jgi:hypothetical protein